MPDFAATAVTSLRGVGPRMAEKLAAAGIERVEDLLFHLPLRYQDRTRITPLGAVQPGTDVVVENHLLRPLLSSFAPPFVRNRTTVRIVRGGIRRIMRGFSTFGSGKRAD